MAIEAGTIAAKVVGISHGKRATGEAILAKGGGVTDNVELEFLDAIPTGTTPATGGNAFLTGVFPGPNTSFEIKAQALNQTMTDSYHVEGALAANAECRWGVDQNLNGVRTNFGILTNMGGWAATYAFYTVAAGNGNTVSFEYKSANPAVYGYDATTKTAYTQAVGFGARTSTVLPDQTAIGTFTKEFMLFGRPTNNTAISPTATITTRAARLYYAKFWENGVLTKHFVPYRKNGVICLWEKVSNTFVYNYGTGYLFAGPEKTSEVPEDNTELEYIETSGTQYIDTGVVATGYTTAQGVFSDIPHPDSGTIAVLFGSRYDTGGYKLFSANIYNDRIKFFYAGSSGILDISQTPSTAVVTLSPTEGRTNSYKGSLTSTKQDYINPIYIFRRSCPSGVDPLACPHGRLHSFKVWEGETLVRDMVPYRKNGVVCMYDKVSQTYFYNAGTGNFTGGPAVSDNERVEYIQSNSCYSVYIDLNSFVDTTNGTSYGVELKWAPCLTTNDRFVFGGGQNGPRIGVYNSGTVDTFHIKGVGDAKLYRNNSDYTNTISSDGEYVVTTSNGRKTFKTMNLFCQNWNGVNGIIFAKVWYLKLTDFNNNLAHHLVPVLHDGTAMVKDLVTGLYYGKVSTCFGNFAAPPPVKEMPDRFIDWQTATLNTKCADPEMDDVVFYNLDGTVCWHGTYKEAQRLSELPTPKEIPGCTFQCWNWTVEDILGLNEMAPWACIAPHYVTNDDKTHIKFAIDGTLNTRTVILSRLMCCSTDNQSDWSFTVDWGDGTVETFPQTARSTTGTTSHTYAADGKYEVTLDATCPFSMHHYNAANYCLFGGSTTANVRDPITRMVTAIYTGSKLRNRSGSRQSNVSYLQNAEYIVIHKDYCTFPSNSGGYTNADGPEFSNNLRARIIAVPRGPVHHHDYAFNGTWNVVNPCSPRTITRYEYYCLTTCHGIKRIVVNPNTTTFSFGDMNSQPNAIVRIDLPKCVDLNTTSERNKNWIWRWWCNAENSWNKYIGWCVRTGTGAITADAGWFQYCTHLKHAYIEVMNASTFTINSNTFATCLSLQDIWFMVSAVPTINSNTTFYGLFSNTVPNCNISNLKIHVPKALYDTWKATAAWAPAANLLVPYEPGECPVFGEENEEYRK